MNESLLQLLSLALHEKADVRSEAEKQLDQLSHSPEFCLDLGKAALTLSLPITIRQLAALTLKNFVTKNWEANKLDFHKIVREPPTHQVKESLKQLLFDGLADSESKIRSAIASVISKIAHREWPEQWPTLLSGLLHLLQSCDPLQVHGAIQVLVEFVKNDVTDKQLPEVAPILLPSLLNVFNDERFLGEVRGQAALVFRECVEAVYSFHESDPVLSEQLLNDTVPKWLHSFASTLKQSTILRRETLRNECDLKANVIRSINTLIVTFPQYVKPFLGTFLITIWQDIETLKKLFVNEVVNAGSNDGLEEDILDDQHKFEMLIYASFEFVGNSLKFKEVKQYFLSKDPNEPDNKFLSSVIENTIFYMQITSEQEDTWIDDANQYVAEEDEGSFCYNVRVAADELLERLISKLKDEALGAFNFAVQNLIKHSEEMHSQGNENWWKIQESFLLAIGRQSYSFSQQFKKQQQLPSRRTSDFDLVGLFDHVVFNNMRRTDLPFLQGRSIWFASRFVKILPSDLAVQYLQSAVNAMQENHPVPVRISAIIAIKTFADYLEVDHMKSFQTDMLNGLVTLIPEAKDDALFLILETLIAVLKIDRETSALYVEKIASEVLKVWMESLNNYTDHLTPQLASEVIETLASLPSCYTLLVSQLVPVICDIYKASFQREIPNLGDAIDLLSIFIKHGSSPLHPGFIQEVFPLLLDVLKYTDDNTALQNGQECLKLFVQKDLTGLCGWRNADGTNGLELIMKFIATLLHPEQSESAALFVGELICKILEKGGEYISVILPEFLKCVTQRLSSAKTSSFIQTLLNVYIKLLLNDTKAVVDLLANIDINGKTGLELVISIWCDQYEDIYGSYNIKSSTIAMTKVVELNDARINSLCVKGDAIIDSRVPGVVTRSKAKKLNNIPNTIPFTCKACKLLLNDFQSAMDGSVTTSNSRWENENEDHFISDADSEDVSEEAVNKISGGLLSDLLNENYEEDMDDEEEDADIKKDPIYNVDIKEYLSTFFHNLIVECPTQLYQLSQQYFNINEQQFVQSLIEKHRQ